MLDEGVEAVMKHYPPHGDVKMDPKLTKLRAESQKVLDKELEEPEEVRVYNRETCIEFHQFLIAVLVGYGKALAAFHDVGGDSRDAVKEKTDQKTQKMDAFRDVTADELNRAVMVWRFGHLLWRIAYSRILHYHLAVSEAGGLLSIPEDLPLMRKRYSKDVGLTDQPEELVKDEDVEDELQSLRDRPRDAKGKGTALAFQRWIRLHVSHFAALDILSLFCRQPGIPKVTFTPLAVRTIIPLSTEPWETTVTNLIPATPAGAVQLSTEISAFDAQAAIDLLRKRIDEVPLDENSPSIFKAFRSREFRFQGNIHCEAALASLTKYVDLAIDSKHNDLDLLRLKTLIESSNQSSIGVSKLSCRVCWELCDILRADTRDFSLRGHHATIYPVQLPVWLPAEVMWEMVDRFRTFLRDELITMMAKEAKAAERATKRALAQQSHSLST